MTSTIEPTTTLAEIINLQPNLARELERRSLDYCCGGRKSLADACEEAGLDPTATAEELSAKASGAPAPWVDLGPAQLVDHVESTHHAYLHEEMPRLSALAAKVNSVHGGRHPELVEVAQTYEQLRAEFDPHLIREEQVLFPMIRELATTAGPAPSFHCGSLANPISVMLAEHDSAGDLLARLRELTSDYTPPADGCASYQALYAGLEEFESDTHIHVHKENNLLFPAVLQLESERAVPASS